MSGGGVMSKQSASHVLKLKYYLYIGSTWAQAKLRTKNFNTQTHKHSKRHTKFRDRHYLYK